MSLLVNPIQNKKNSPQSVNCAPSAIILFLLFQIQTVWIIIELLNYYPYCIELLSLLYWIIIPTVYYPYCYFFHFFCSLLNLLNWSCTTASRVHKSPTPWIQGAIPSAHLPDVTGAFSTIAGFLLATPCSWARDCVLVCAYMFVYVFAYMGVGVYPLTYFSSISCAASSTSNPFFYLCFTFCFLEHLSVSLCFASHWRIAGWQCCFRGTAAQLSRTPTLPQTPLHPACRRALSAVPCAVQWVLVGYPF